MRKSIHLLPIALLTAAIALTGCDIRQAGTACAAGAAPARNETYVLTCENGRWTQSITLQKAAELLAPAAGPAVRIVGGTGMTQSIVAGEKFAPARVTVVDADGRTVKDAKLVITTEVGAAGVVSVQQAGAAEPTLPVQTLTGKGVVRVAIAQPQADGSTKELAPVWIFWEVKAAAPVELINYAFETQSTPVNTDFPNLLRVIVRDRYGNWASELVTWTVTAGTTGASGTVNPLPLGNGPQVALVKANGVVGDFAVTASVGGLPPLTVMLHNS